MRRKQKQLILFIFFGLVIFLTVYLALKTQLIFKRAAFGQVTVNFAPATINKMVNEEFGVEVYFNSGDLPVSAVSLTALQVPANLTYVRADPEYGEGKPFTDVIVGTGQNLLPITLVARKATEALPRGNFKVATFYFKGTAAATGTLALSNATVEVVGYNQTNQDVNLTLAQGTTTAYTITSVPLCRVGSCSSSIVLTNALRSDSKYNINVSWTPPTGVTSPYFKVYRNVGAAVPNTHVDANLVTTTDQTSMVDTNADAGFTGSSTVYYDVDTYVACP